MLGRGQRVDRAERSIGANEGRAVSNFATKGLLCEQYNFNQQLTKMQ
jgi:hypothetical protein